MFEYSPLEKILFVCRGSVRDGLGHVIRSRTVAFELAQSTSVRILVIGDCYADTLLRGHGINYQVVGSEDEALLLFRKFLPNIVIFDLMEISKEFFCEVKRKCMTVSLSPIFNMLKYVDVIFHRTKYFDQGWKLTDSSPLLRCGLDYTVVRNSCWEIPEDVYCDTIKHKPFSIAISMGGGDAGNKTLKVLKSIRTIPNQLLLWVLLGEGYEHSYRALVDCIKEDSHHEIILVKTNDSMWRVIKACSIIILGGGTVTYEAVRAGLPSINVFDKSEHLFLIRELVELGCCFSAGYPFEDALSVVNALLIRLDNSREELLKMHQNCKGVIDGRGAKRIAKEIVEFYRGFWLKNESKVGLCPKCDEQDRFD